MNKINRYLRREEDLNDQLIKKFARISFVPEHCEGATIPYTRPSLLPCYKEYLYLHCIYKDEPIFRIIAKPFSEEFLKKIWREAIDKDQLCVYDTQRTIKGLGSWYVIRDEDQAMSSVAITRDWIADNFCNYFHVDTLHFLFINTHEIHVFPYVEGKLSEEVIQTLLRNFESAKQNMVKDYVLPADETVETHLFSYHKKTKEYHILG